MFVKWLRAVLVITLVTLFGCGGGGDKSSVQVGGLTYVAHDFSASPETLDGAFATTKLALFVKEQSGSQLRPYSNATVIYESPCLLDGRARVTDQQVYNGNYQATYMNLGCSGSDRVEAKVSVGTVSIAPLQKTLTIINYIPPLSDLYIVATNATVPADGSSKTQVRVRAVSRNAAGAEVPISGVPVSFTTTLGTLSSATATTDAGGYASVFLVSGTQSGTATISASAAGFVRTVSVGIGSISPPVRIVATANPGRVNPRGTTSIEAIVLDSAGIGVPDVNLIYEVTSNISGGRLSTFSSMTNAQGIATVNYQAGDSITDTQNVSNSGVITWVAGYDVISINTNNGVIKTVNVRVNNNNTEFDFLTLTTGGTYVPATSQVKVLLQALVVDGKQQPLAGRLVTYTTTHGILVDIDGNPQTTALTGNDGIAKVYLTVPSVPDETDVTVSASYDGVVATQQITFYPNP